MIGPILLGFVAGMLCLLILAGLALRHLWRHHRQATTNLVASLKSRCQLTRKENDRTVMHFSSPDAMLLLIFTRLAQGAPTTPSAVIRTDGTSPLLDHESESDRRALPGADPRPVEPERDSEIDSEIDPETDPDDATDTGQEAGDTEFKECVEPAPGLDAAVQPDDEPDDEPDGESDEEGDDLDPPLRSEYEPHEFPSAVHDWYFQVSGMTGERYFRQLMQLAKILALEPGFNLNTFLEEVAYRHYLEGGLSGSYDVASATGTLDFGRTEIERRLRMADRARDRELRTRQQEAADALTGPLPSWGLVRATPLAAATAAALTPTTPSDDGRKEAPAPPVVQRVLSTRPLRELAHTTTL
ncbi:hypothetical protein JNJ66_04665 [Candidatus Saccharibacteria bacterium]|nr:hypothetical protein [Candidatus Saccharibacteria bacterium]